MSWEGRRLHFVGIGGAGMSGLALVAKALGASVTGTDQAESAYMERLRATGVEPVIGHGAEHVPDGAEVVYSTAVGPENPERVVARERGTGELHRADLLAELTRLRRTVAITGTHGKTTTASMTAHALIACGLDPGYLIGGELRSTGANAGWGSGDLLVVEADESDRSLLKLDAWTAVLTNAELDHHSTYASRLDVEATFREFMARAEHRIAWEREGALALAGPGAIGYDVPEPLLDADGVRFAWRGHEVRLRVPGAHNALNAAAALEACRVAGADLDRAVAALSDFTGAGRRFEALGATSSGARVYDDYAHHPTEVRATLAGARTLAPARLVAVFQPHLFSRTAALAREFGAALALADVVVVLDVYAA
ncbi:MAG: UDP-N-acetylmuramate--L-alanine ligase, partial [Solirubrobacterales bacterium]|nr:UDP-N-acetylmuramate--L-alanine ligase [Solirubrobacterales bacterium]